MCLGTADWHYLRKFSLTSSQAHIAFKKAFPAFREDESFIAVAKYMFGDENWKSSLLTQQQQQQDDEQINDEQVELNNDDDSSSSINADGPLNPKSLFRFISEFVPDENSDTDFLVALRFIKEYVGVQDTNSGSSTTNNSDSHDDSLSDVSVNSSDAELLDKSVASALSTSELSSNDEQDSTPAIFNHNITTRRRGQHARNASDSCDSSSDTSSLIIGGADAPSQAPSDGFLIADDDNSNEMRSCISLQSEEEPFGKIVESELDAKEIIKKLNAKTKKHVLNLLCKHVHEDHGKNGPTKDLIGWLQQNNSIRNFYFPSKLGYDH